MKRRHLLLNEKTKEGVEINKQEILEKIQTSEIDLHQIIILSGASLVLQNIIEETRDIDMSCNQNYYDSIDWEAKIGAFGKEIKYKDVFEIGNHLYDPKNTIKVNGISCMTIEKCLEIKERLNRERDKEVIEKLREKLKRE